jgi:hypothetical protein
MLMRGSGYLFLLVTTLSGQYPHIDAALYLSSLQTMLDNPMVMYLGGYSFCQANIVVEP